MTVSTPSDLLQEGLALHRRGAAAEAAARYAEVLRIEPGNADAHYYLGMMSCQNGRFAEGAEHARQSLAREPRHARAHVLLGRALDALGQRDEALKSFDRAITIAPALAQAHAHRADLLGELGRNEEAVESYDRALALAPDVVEDWFSRGEALITLGRYEEAVASFDRVLALKPDFPQAHLRNAGVLSKLCRHEEALEAIDRGLAAAPDFAQAWISRGDILRDLKRYVDALDAYDKGLGLAPELATAWLGRGNALVELKRPSDAFAAYDRALAIKPDLAEAWLGRGIALLVLRQYEHALVAFSKALSLRANLAEAWLGRGNALVELKRPADAFAAYDRALAIKTDSAEAWFGRGIALQELKRYDDALAAYDRALALKESFAEAWFGRGGVLFELGRYREAANACDKGLVQKPTLDYAASLRVHAKQCICDWSNIDAQNAELLANVRDRKASTYGFVLLAAPSSSADQLQCALRHVQDHPAYPPLCQGDRHAHERIRIAYLSADFAEHATASLLAGLFERHDRSRFEITGLSFGSNRNSTLRRRIEGGLEHFFDVRDENDRDIANLVRRLEIDIAVDLMGFTKNNRFGVLARRPAPIQVNYLGYVGSMGADFIDYVIADEIALPFDQQPFFAEKIVHLPGCFLVTDDRQEISPHTPSRAEAGLPPEGFVFCSFNNSYKLNGPIFELWMRLLGGVPGSVLWLVQANGDMVVNLRREGQRCGIAPERIVFAPRLPLPQHLARQRLAGLFLDTVPYNAGATGAAALWSGVPVLTMAGQTFVGRMAASMLHAVGLPELVTQNLEDYEAIALKLARDPELLSGIRHKLQDNLRITALFDTDRFRRNLEKAYSTMVDIWKRGASPRSFAVELT